MIVDILNRILGGAFGFSFGAFVLIMGKNALLSQENFLRLFRELQRVEKRSAISLDYFGGPARLRALGVLLTAAGLFIVVSVAVLVIPIG